MDVPVLGAAAYTGLAVWHGGLSGSAPLKAAEAAQFTEGAGAAIPVGETLFSSLNLAVSGGLLVALPAMCIALAPKQSEVPKPIGHAPNAASAEGRSILGLVVGGTAVALVAFGWVAGDLTFNLNSVNLFFLGLALAAHGSGPTCSNRFGRSHCSPLPI